MALAVERSTLQGTFHIPPSKSQTMRALLFAFLAEGVSEIENVLPSPDTDYLIRNCRLLGAQIEKKGTTLQIHGVGKKWTPPSEPLYVGNSGIQLRFLAALAATQNFPIEIRGDKQISSERSVVDLVEALRSLHVKVTYLEKEGFTPFIVQGPLEGGRASLEGRDSQPVSALLIAMALTEKSFTLEVKNPGETPWVELTMHWLRRFQVGLSQNEYKHYEIAGGGVITPFFYRVPADFSTASFPAAAALVTRSEVEIETLDWKDPQGDKELFTIFSKMGAAIEKSEHGVRISAKELCGVEVDIDKMVDMLPILAVVAATAKGSTYLYNGASLRGKESDRLKCTASELKKMGIHVEEGRDWLKIEGGSLKGSKVSSFGDHRMAMSLAVAGMGASGITSIDDELCIEKTYPHFVRDFQKNGAKISCL